MEIKDDKKHYVVLLEKLTEDESHIVNTRLQDLRNSRDLSECKERGIAALEQLSEIIELRKQLITTVLQSPD